MPGTEYFHEREYNDSPPPATTAVAEPVNPLRNRMTRETFLGDSFNLIGEGEILLEP